MNRPALVLVVNNSASIEDAGGSSDYVQTMEKWYKWSLYTNALYVDTFWHYYTPSTEQYAKDCQNMCEYFLHNFSSIAWTTGRPKIPKLTIV